MNEIWVLAWFRCPLQLNKLLLLIFDLLLFQETSFGGGQSVVTRKVSTTSMSSKGPTAQVVTVTRSHSDLNKTNRTVNGAAHTHAHDISPWQVTPVINDAPSSKTHPHPHPHPHQGVPPQPARRLHLTTELWCCYGNSTCINKHDRCCYGYTRYLVTLHRIVCYWLDFTGF